MTLNESIISWNVPNWITVILMAALGYMLIKLGQKLYNQQRGG